MPKLTKLFTLATLAIATTSTAQVFPPTTSRAPLRATALAPGEIILMVRGRGEQTSKPDFATLTVMLGSTGVDNNAAVNANRKLIEQVTKILSTLGIEPNAVQMLSVNAMAMMGFVGNMPDPDGDGPSPPARPGAYANSSMVIRFTDMDKVFKVREALQLIGSVQAAAPEYGVNDDSSAKRAAIDQALAKAHLDADLYAKAMNMRVDRIIEVRDGGATMDAEGFAAMIAERGRPPATGVRTAVRVEVDVVLRPL